jgi:hypothetical protein
MARRARWLAPSGAALAVAAAAALYPDTVLELENAARGQTFRIPVGGEVFAVVAHHSIYDQPVTEEFVVGAEGRIVLVSVSSPSDSVREYFGISAPGERHAMKRAMPEVVFRIAAGEPQRLRLRGVDRSFLELGDHGDRLVMRAARRPAVARWIDRLAGVAR